MSGALKEEVQFAKKHIRNRFSIMLLPHISDGIWSVYDNAKTICEKNNQTDQILKTFQNLLTRIPTWTEDVLTTEVKRITAASKCSYLEELLTGVLITYLRAFAAVQYRSTKDSIEVEFERPPLPKFVHELYKEVARRCWEHAYLFRTFGVTTEQQARNRKEIDTLLDTTFDVVLDSFLPWQSIVNTYFSAPEKSQTAEDVIQPTETETEVHVPTTEEPAAAPGPAPESEVKKEVSFGGAEIREHDTDDEEEDVPKMKVSEEDVSLDVPEDEKTPEEKEEKVDVEAKDGELVLKL
jgi:hypothetical protein